MRSWLDENGLWLGDAHPDVQRAALDDLSDVLEEILQHRDEELYCLESIDDAEVREGVSLDELLYRSAGVVPALRDAKRRFALNLQRVRRRAAPVEVEALPVPWTDTSARAPSLSLRCALAAAVGAPVALLAFSTALPPLSELVGGLVWAVSCPADRPPFVRAWLVAVPPSPSGFKDWLARAFPRLRWAANAERGLHAHSRCFFGDRFPTTLLHLGVLSDEGAELFNQQSLPELRVGRLGSKGVTASSESPKTKANARARRQRTAEWEGQSVVFWWHTKIRPTEGRIHFHHHPSPPPGYIVIGMVSDHFDT